MLIIFILLPYLFFFILNHTRPPPLALAGLKKTFTVHTGLKGCALRIHSANFFDPKTGNNHLQALLYG